MHVHDILRTSPVTLFGRRRWQLCAAMAFLLVSTLHGQAQELSPWALVQLKAGELSSQMAARCQAWHAKALSGAWFTSRDKKDYDATEQDEETLSRLPACKSFFALSSTCQGIWATFVGDVPTDPKKKARLATQVIAKIEATAGCKSILGIDACEVIEGLPPPLSKDHKAMLSDCADESVRSNRASLTRPAL
jgi:hypothetical protein